MPHSNTSPLDVTLDATPDVVSLSNSPSRAARPVAVVEGSGPQLTAETQNVLRWRLRVAALALFGGFAVFFVYKLLVSDWQDPVERNMFFAHAAVTVLLGLLGGALCRGCQIPMLALRVEELLVFGVPAAFFVMMQWYWVRQCAAEHRVIPSVVGPWFMLMFTYALFIPNTWRRAAAVLGGMAAIPMVLMVILWTQSTPCAIVFSSRPGAFVENALVLAIGAAVGTLGTHTIGSLRREAFEAKRLGQYHLKKLIGLGGMGEVHLAEHQLMKRPCAIKLIHPEKAGDPKVLARFEREVRATARLSHWNTVEIFDYGRADNGAFYYVMEFLPGLSLGDLVTQHGPLESGRVIYLLRQVCDALGEAHANGLIHRDIKPGNIFAAQRGGVYDVAKLLDFGLVKPLAEAESLDITQDGSITGSPLYMAPEQATADSEADERGDIYALGGVAYFLLTGHAPFEGEKPLAIILAHAREKVVPPSQLRADVPHDLEQVVLRCLEKSPDDRYANVSELDAALAGCDAADDWDRSRARHWWHANGLGDAEVKVAATV